MPLLFTANWRELPRPNKSECPKLFYFFSTEQDSLIIKLTDLVMLWESSLDRTGIIDAAKTQQTSIDPSESSGQLRVLLEKLEQSLNSGANCLFRSEDLDAQTVHLKTKLDLPKPLKPLSWTFELIPKDAAELAEQLLRPCLHEASIARQKVESLIRVIKDKDHVLSRLLEKVDSSAIDLSLIFPGVTGLRSRKGRVTTRDAQKHVPGMSEFDQTKWNNNFDADTLYTGFHQLGMDNLVTGCEKCPKHTVKQHTDWLKGLPIGGSDTETVGANEHGPAKSGAPEQYQCETTSSDAESDFDRQPTPPRIKSALISTKRRQRSQSSDSSSSLDGQKPRPKKKSKLGQVAGHGNQDKSKQFLRQESALSQPESSTVDKLKPADFKLGSRNSHQQDSGSETETASEAEADVERPSNSLKASSSLPSERGPTQSKPGKLGRLASQSSRAQHEITRSSSRTRRDRRHSSSIRSSSRSPLRQGSKVNSLRNLRSSQEQLGHTESKAASDGNGNGQKNTNTQSSQNPLKQEQNEPLAGDIGNGSKLPATPTRKLGRLQPPRSGSTASTDNLNNTPTRNKAKESRSPSKQIKTKTSNPHTDIDTDTATDTASEAEAEDELNAMRPLDDTAIPTLLSRKASSLSKLPKSTLSSSTSTPDPETELDVTNNKHNKNNKAASKPETVKEKADRRREELKRRLNTTGGARKVRKF